MDKKHLTAKFAKKRKEAQRMMCCILRDKNVFIYPDVGSEDKWAEAAKLLFPSHSIPSLHDKESGVDIADILCRSVNTVV